MSLIKEMLLQSLQICLKCCNDVLSLAGLEISVEEAFDKNISGSLIPWRSRCMTKVKVKDEIIKGWPWVVIASTSREIRGSCDLKLLASRFRIRPTHEISNVYMNFFLGDYQHDRSDDSSLHYAP